MTLVSSRLAYLLLVPSKQRTICRGMRWTLVLVVFISGRGHRVQLRDLRPVLELQYVEPAVAGGDPEVKLAFLPYETAVRLGPGKDDGRRYTLKDVQQRAGIDLGRIRRRGAIEIRDFPRLLRIMNVEYAHARLMAGAGEQRGIAWIVEGAVVHAVAVAAHGGGDIVFREFAVCRIVDANHELGYELGLVDVADVDEPLHAVGRQAGVAGIHHALGVIAAARAALIADAEIGFPVDKGQVGLDGDGAVHPIERAGDLDDGIRATLLHLAHVIYNETVARLVVAGMRHAADHAAKQ